MANTISATLASISQANARTGFEVQFNNLQNTLIKRFNKGVDKINDSTTTHHQIERLEAKSARLVDTLPILEQYRIGNQNNYGQLEVIQEDLSDLQALISNDNTVTPDEVAAYDVLRHKIAPRVNNIYLFVHPDINDGQATQRFKESLNAFTALTPVVGSLDVDNAGLTEGLNTFINNAATAATVTSNTITTALDLEFKVQADFSNVDSELLNLTFEESQRRHTQIEDLKVDLGNTLRAISLSLEINSELATQLNKSLSPQVPPAGSVLNFFT